MSRDLPLSPGQLGAWESRALFATDDPYIEITRFDTGRPVDADILAASFCELVKVSPILQIVFVNGPAGPRQRCELAPPDQLVIRHSVAGLPYSERRGAAEDLIGNFFDNVIDAQTGPHAQMCLVDHGDGRISGAARASRLVFGRPRWFQLWQRLREIYAARTTETVDREELGQISPPADLEVRIEQAWQEFNSTAPAAQQFWEQRLPADLPILALPMRSLDATARYTAMRGEFVPINIAPATIAKLRKVAEQLGADVSAIMHATLAALMNRYGDNELVPVARYFNQGHIGSDEPTVRVNLLPTLVTISPDTRFCALVASVEAEYESLTPWQHVPLALLDLPHRISIDHGVDSAMQVGFRYWDASGLSTGLVGGLADDESAFWPARRFRPNTDVELSATDFGNDLAVGIHYCTDLFDPRVIDDMAGHYRRLLDAFVDDPQLRVGQPKMLGTAERKRLLETWNATGVAYQDQATITDLINDSFSRNPDNVAMRFDSASITYAELQARATHLAQQLLDHGVKVGDRVALMLERSPHMIEAIVATLMVGAAYVPMETDLPAQRAADLVEISGAVCAIADESMLGILPDALPVIAANNQQSTSSSASLPPIEFGPDSLAYVLFTSGSTGRPKAAQVRHSGIVNLINWMATTYGIDSTDNVMLKTPYAHDISVTEIFMPLFVGGCIVIAEPDGHRDPRYLIDLVERENVSVIHFVPTMLAEFAHASYDRHPVSLKHIMVAGEALTKELALQVLSFPGWQLHNLYGTTECSDLSTAWDVVTDDPSSGCPIGRPLFNVRLYVLGPDNEPRPVGVPGELCVGGISVGAGYLGAPEATAKAFVPNPFEPGTTMYRSGDMCRYRPDGVLEYVQRGDGEVKIRGHRVDLNEIASRVSEHPKVSLAVVVVREDTPGLRRLVAYVETSGGVDAHALREWCKLTLAEYMIPSVFVLLDLIPHTTSGKIDRKKLPPLPEPQVIDTGDARAPSNETERLVADVWCEALNIPSVDIDQDFYDLGGDSILAIRIATALQRHGHEVSVRDIFRKPTVAGLALLLGPVTAESTRGSDAAVWNERIQSALSAAAPRHQIRPRKKISSEPRILITGATGFLGRNLVAGLLESTDAKVVCLVRDQPGRAGDVHPPADIHQRVVRAVSAARPAAIQSEIEELTGTRLRVISADLQTAELGLDDRSWDELVASVNSIVHVGAWVHHLHPYRRLAPTNVGATSELLRMATEAGGIPMRFVSTISAVLYDGDTRIAENETEPPPDSGGYIESKWVAEQMVARVRANGVPVQTVHPPWLYASSIDGSFNPDDALTRFILGCIRVKAIPDSLGIHPMLCIDHAVTTLIDSDLFADPPNGSAYLPFVNIETSEIFDHVRDLGIPLDTLSVSQWRDLIHNDADNPATPVLSDFGLAVGEDPDIARAVCPPASPTVGTTTTESFSAIMRATGKMVAETFH